MKRSATRDITVGGAALAAEAIRAGLVDECHLLLGPITVGHGKPALPRHAHMHLTLLDERRFRNGVVYLSYHVDG
jgi:dihydrofolate reductase